MRALVRTGLTVETATPWGLCEVRPPSLREALGVLLSAEGAAQGDPDAGHVFYSALRSWLCEGSPSQVRLYSLFRAEAYPTTGAVRWALKAIEAASPQFEGSGGKGEATTWQDIDWQGRVADYAHAYGMSPTEVMGVPFSTFTLFLKGVERVHAREDLRKLWVQGLPYEDDDRKRNESLRAKQEAAGFDVEDEDDFDELSEEEAIERQKEVLARMNRRLGRG